MMETTKDLLEKAKHLPLAERAALVDALLETIDANESERDRKWSEEAQSRLRAYRSGELPALDADALLKRLIKSADISQLNDDVKLDLVEELWDSIDVDAIPVTDAQRDELERRVAEHLANPEDLVSWDEVKASVTKHNSK
jgi:putative addiction module component (TIGR02574 family)